MTFAKRLAEARRTAARWHAGQTYGHHPYTMHLDEVLAVALQYEIEDEDILLATRFHDAIEDVEGITPQTIVATTGNTRVALLAWAVTNEEGKNRKVRAKKPTPRLRASPELRSSNSATGSPTPGTVGLKPSGWMPTNGTAASSACTVPSTPASARLSVVQRSKDPSD